MMAVLTAGIDSSTQSCKVLITDVRTGEITRQGRAAHSDGTEVNPQVWWDALMLAIEQAGGIDDVEALSIAGQQHGMVCLDKDGSIVRDALLWNDTRSADAAEDLIKELGQGDVQRGRELWAQKTGSVPVASLTIAKLRWLVDNEPDNADRVAAVCLPHDYLTWRLSGSNDVNDLVTDRSDASGTGYMNIHTGEYDRDLLELALRRNADDIVLPRIADPFDSVGCAVVKDEWQHIRLGPGCGDNAGAALGVELTTGTASLSLGTSGVIAAVSSTPVCDPSGLVSGFADASGRWLPLACTLNASRIIDAMRTLLGVDYQRFDELALSANSQGVVLTPYFEGERTPNLPHATASLTGLTLGNTTPATVARASVEGLCTLMRGALNAVRQAGCEVQQAVMLGGGAQSKAVQELMPQILGIPIRIAETKEYVALGAAKQAANCL